MTEVPSSSSCYFDRSALDLLFDLLDREGFRVVGPTVSDGAIVYGPLRSSKDLPVGWTDEQDGGTYRLRRRSDEACFGYAVGPHSWKRYVSPASRRLWQARRSPDGRRMEIVADPEPSVRYAFVGVRSCELHAIALQDRVFLRGDHPDPHYAALRERSFIVALSCGVAGGTCFCVSTRTGPRATGGYDIALTEILEQGRHGFVARSGSDRGLEVLRALPRRAARAEEQTAARRVVERTAEQMGRTLDTRQVLDRLPRRLEHPRWEQVAERCLSCGNCTLVCPTCFCYSVDDVTDLAGGVAERVRRWESCFSVDFSYIHGGSVRPSTRSRYRQWMTHKLAHWHDQFGLSGCVGCGRCITWCPVGIDITEEARAITAEGDPAGRQVRSAAEE